VIATVARSAGSIYFLPLEPGACAPGFMLSPAPQAATHLDQGARTVFVIALIFDSFGGGAWLMLQ
jgi:hypothetical protein